MTFNQLTNFFMDNAFVVTCMCVNLDLYFQWVNWYDLCAYSMWL